MIRAILALLLLSPTAQKLDVIWSEIGHCSCAE